MAQASILYDGLLHKTWDSQAIGPGRILSPFGVSSEPPETYNASWVFQIRNLKRNFALFPSAQCQICDELPKRTGRVLHWDSSELWIRRSYISPSSNVFHQEIRKGNISCHEMIWYFEISKSYHRWLTSLNIPRPSYTKDNIWMPCLKVTENRWNAPKSRRNKQGRDCSANIVYICF